MAELAAELGVYPKTIYRWRSRISTRDLSHRSHRLATSLSPLEEALIIELRNLLALPLDDITEAMRCWAASAPPTAELYKQVQRVENPIQMRRAIDPELVATVRPRTFTTPVSNLPSFTKLLTNFKRQHGSD